MYPEQVLERKFVFFVFELTYQCVSFPANTSIVAFCNSCAQKRKERLKAA